MSRSLFVGPLLFFASTLPLASSRAASGPGFDEIIIEAQEEPEAEAPFRSPVTFTLQSGAPGDTVWGEQDASSFLAGVRRWQIQIFDFDGKKVDYIQGVGRPPSTPIPWDGAGGDGRMLRDAFYTVRFVWQDAAGASRASAAIKVGLLTPPGLQDFIGPQVRLDYTADGMTIRVSEQLTFAAGKWDLRSEATDTLERIAGFLRRYPQNRLVVVGHSDTTGTESFNRMISLRRSQSIYRFLLAHGVGGDRLTYQGLGAAEPLVSNLTPEGRRQNRRVEIMLLKAKI